MDHGARGGGGEPADAAGARTVDLALRRAGPGRVPIDRHGLGDRRELARRCGRDRAWKVDGIDAGSRVRLLDGAPEAAIPRGAGAGPAARITAVVDVEG